jgi:hypothetical protein
MNTLPFLPLAVSWAVLALVVLGLIVYRKKIAAAEDDTLHVLDASATSQQSSIARKLESIDRWGKVLTAVAFLYGLVVAAVYLYNVWNATPTY